jgi:hypothetical protein
MMYKIQGLTCKQSPTQEVDIYLQYLYNILLENILHTVHVINHPQYLKLF